MSNRDMCISVINSMEEWQLQSVLEMLNAVKGTTSYFAFAFLRAVVSAIVPFSFPGEPPKMATPFPVCHYYTPKAHR